MTEHVAIGGDKLVHYIAYSCSATPTFCRGCSFADVANDIGVRLPTRITQHGKIMLACQAGQPASSVMSESFYLVPFLSRFGHMYLHIISVADSTKFSRSVAQHD